MFSRFVWYLDNEQIMETFKTTVEHVVTHCIVEKIDDFGKATFRVRKDELLSSDEHDVVKENVISGVVSKRVPHRVIV